MSDYGLKKVSGYIADTQRCYQGNYCAIFPQLSLSGDLGSGISNQILLLNSPGMEKTDTDNDNLKRLLPFMQTSDSGYAVTEMTLTQDSISWEPFLPMRFLRILQIRTARMKTIRVMQRIQTQRQQDLRCFASAS